MKKLLLIMMFFASCSSVTKDEPKIEHRKPFDNEDHSGYFPKEIIVHDTLWMCKPKPKIERGIWNIFIINSQSTHNLFVINGDTMENK